MMCVRLTGGGQDGIFLADLVPTAAHLPFPWIMGYDLYPMTTLENKKKWIPQAAREGWLVIFGHEPKILPAYLREKDGKYVLEPVVIDRKSAYRARIHSWRRRNIDEGAERRKPIQSALASLGAAGSIRMPGLENTREVRVKTPFGDPSDALVVGTLEGKRVAFLARHGRGHRFLPSEINYRANIHAMKQLGVERIISVSAVGSLQEDLKPLDFLIPDQFYDRTRHRISTFFGDGMVAHVGFDKPVCAQLAGVLGDACDRARVHVHRGGTYVCMEGPQFSTLAEAHVHRQLRFEVIGMTNVTEAKLAREAEICYATVAMITDYDCWHPESRFGDSRGDHREFEPQCRKRAEHDPRSGAADARGARLPMRLGAWRTRLLPIFPSFRRPRASGSGVIAGKYLIPGAR